MACDEEPCFPTAPRSGIVDFESLRETIEVTKRQPQGSRLGRLVNARTGTGRCPAKRGDAVGENLFNCERDQVRSP